ncbi:MAG: hypothetical protein H7259_01840, partial [Cytophagales bacterium]|nr:hypothetical protein [Cytophaga sp.]
ALVTFYCDKKVRHQELQISDKSLMYDPAFNLNPMINKAYNTFITEFSGDFHLSY